MLELRLLGQFELRRHTNVILLPSRPAQSLLAYLALTAGTAHRREKLAGMLWPEADEDNARSYLRHALWRTRKAIESDEKASPYLLSDELAISFNAGGDYWLDAAVLSRSGESLQELVQSVDVYRGELLPGFYDEWVAPERERLESLFEQRVQRLLDRLVDEHRWSDVLEWGDRWLALGRAPEPGYRALMLAHAELGDRGRVAAIYQRCQEALFNELGVQPSLQTRRLFERLTRGDETAIALNGMARPPSEQGAEMTGPAPGQPPYLGLHHFDEGDAERFFGRERLTTRLVARLRTEHFLAIVGASGSGKSSVLRAGLVAALRRRVLDDAADAAEWDIHSFTPTDEPLRALVDALVPGASAATYGAALLGELSRDPLGLQRYLRRSSGHPRGRRTALIVDQFEELFTLCHDAFEREAFVENVLAAAEHERATVVLAVRADFYAHCAEYPALRQALAEHQEYVGALTAAELQRAIEAPAQQGSWELESGLVNLLLRDVGEEPGALPLLSHALLETWQRRRGRRLTLEGYAAAGGVQGAIAQTAETVFRQRLTPVQQALARRLFLQLTELGEGTQDTRRRAFMSDLIRSPGEHSEVRAVLEVLAEARLVTLGRETVEVAHEALIREWPALREWLNHDRQSLRLHRQVTESAREWVRLDRDAGLTYRGARLAQTIEWAADHEAELSELERTFLQASQDLAEGEAREREAQRVREVAAAQKLADTEHRAATQLRQRAFLLTAAFVLALAMAGATLFFGTQARRNAEVAELGARVASARELASSAVANLDSDPERSILLALQGVAITGLASQAQPIEVEDALHRAVQASRVRLTLRGHAGRVQSIVFGPDGSRVVTGSADRTARVWDASTGAQLLTLSGHTDEITTAAFSPDGTRIATASSDHTARVWDATTGTQLLTLRSHTDQVRSVAFSPDGSRLATVSADRTARVWNASTGQQLLRPLEHGQGLLAAAYSPDGSRLATAGRDGTAKVWDATTGEDLLTLSGHTFEVICVAFSPDGRYIATGGADSSVREWDAATGTELRVISTEPSPVESVAFSPDGMRLAAARFGGAVTVWETATWKPSFVLRGHSSWVSQASFSPDGTRLATSSADGTARIWDALPSRTELFTLVGHTASVFDVKFSPDGDRLATASYDSTARLWDAANGSQSVRLAGHTDRLFSVAWNPDGTHVATASADGTARVWDSATGRQLVVLSGHGPPLLDPEFPAAGQVVGVVDVAFSPDGTRLATAGVDGTARLWDMSTGGMLKVFNGHRARISSVAFSPDGARLATASDDFTAKLWDVSSGLAIRTLAGHTLRVWRVVFSPDGVHLATGSADGTAKIWDTTSGDEVFTLRGQAGVINPTYSRDGTRLASAATDGSVKLWDAFSGRELLMLEPSSSSATRVAFSPDGSRVAVASQNNTAGVYLLRPAELVALAQRRVTRGLTPDECQRFLHFDHCPS